MKKVINFRTLTGKIHNVEIPEKWYEFVKAQLIRKGYEICGATVK